MACFSPIKAFKSKIDTTANGKAKILFNIANPNLDKVMKIDLPCQNCIGCRIDRSRQWALRCVHEASLYPDNCFLTLTFDDEHLNKNQNLVKSDFQKFMKRLRKKFNGTSAVNSKTGTIFHPYELQSFKKDNLVKHENVSLTYPIRYFHCGEYGSDLSRPHHHCCLFNFDFKDKELWSVRENSRLYRSESLEKLWPFGFSCIGDVTWQSAAYVARYITKKINGPDGEQHYQQIDHETGELIYLNPEYITMSRRPGIGKRWYDQFTSDLFPKDYITHNGKKHKIPKYYDRNYEATHPVEMEEIKFKRLLASDRRIEDNTYERLAVRKEVLCRKTNTLVREYEQ